MMTRQVYKKMLMAAMVVVIGMGMGSCVDNIDNSTTPSEKEQQEQQAEEARQAKAQKFWAVVSHLVDVDDYTDDYEDMTFEPTYGVSQGDDGTRYVYTNDMATAAERFGDLVDCDDIDEDTPSYTYDDPDVGTLVYTKGTGRTLATVEVRVKQIPTLKKIIYVPGAYANGSFQGRAYYRFGDVVSRPGVDYEGHDITEYWICVRPSFGLEGKGDSHWVCLNVLPDKNTWHHSGSNEQEYYLPTGLGTNEEHMQNLAELLYAIYNPSQWEENLILPNQKDAPKMFHDFSYGNQSYHNKYFWKNVQDEWRDKEILKKALNYSGSEEDFRNMLNGDGLRLLYRGYSWWTKTSWNCTLYEAHFQDGNTSKEKNMHMVEYRDIPKNMHDFGMDCRKMGQDYSKLYESFFGDGHLRWTVRHATGKDLLERNAKYDKQSAIQGVTEVYRYYHHVENTTDYRNNQPEVTPGNVPKDRIRVGYIIGADGTFYRSCEDANDNHQEPTAMIVYLGKDQRVEKDMDWNALAIYLKDLDKSQYGGKVTFCTDDEQYVNCTTNVPTTDYLPYRCDGWAMTKRMNEAACGNDHDHPAADAVWGMDKIEDDDFSDWFIPSTGQWHLALQGMGNGELKADGTYTKNGNWIWNDVEVNKRFYQGDLFMTCTANTYEMNVEDYGRASNKIHVVSYDNDGYFAFKSALKTSNDLCIRPFVAFTYGSDEAVNNPEEPWKPLSKPYQHSWIGEDGKFYTNSADAFANTGYPPVAWTVYMAYTNRFKVNGKEYSGLAIGTYPQPLEGLAWDLRDSYISQYKTRLTDALREEKGFSEWFIASKELWQAALETPFFFTFENGAVKEDVKGSKQKKICDYFTENGLQPSGFNGPYWTNTDKDEQAYYIDLIEGHTIQFLTTDKMNTEVWGKKMRVRPMIAF
jgi:hypothetical protein